MFGRMSANKAEISAARVSVCGTLITNARPSKTPLNLSPMHGNHARRPFRGFNALRIRVHNAENGMSVATTAASTGFIIEKTPNSWSRFLNKKTLPTAESYRVSIRGIGPIEMQLRNLFPDQYLKDNPSPTIWTTEEINDSLTIRV